MQVGAGAVPRGAHYPDTLPTGYCLTLGYQAGIAVTVNSLPPVPLIIGSMIDNQ